jgi:hypothetical protein
MACSSAGTERSRASVVHTLISRCHSYVCVIAEFSQTIDDSTAPLNDAMREPVTTPPPPCSNLGWDVMGKGWLFMRVLDPRICVRHMRFRAKTEAVRMIAYFCARSTAPTNCLRVYWACPASHMMLVSGLGNKQPRTRHGKVRISPFLQSQFHTRISPPTFHFLLPSHTPVRLSSSLSISGGRTNKTTPARRSCHRSIRCDNYDPIRHATPWSSFCVFTSQDDTTCHFS